MAIGKIFPNVASEVLTVHDLGSNPRRELYVRVERSKHLIVMVLATKKPRHLRNVTIVARVWQA
jgi:hypothetical protein